MHLSDAQSRTLLDLARSTIRAALLAQLPPSIETQDADLVQPAGCFVSLHVMANHALRGCVGRMDASEPLIRAVRDTAMSVLGDPRFDDRPVTYDELHHLEIEISILSPLRPAAGPLEFDPMNHGIYLTCAGRAGVFLPQVARETGWSREQLLDRLCTEKIGLPPGCWRHPEARLHLFSTLILGPVPFVDSPLPRYSGGEG